MGITETGSSRIIQISDGVIGPISPREMSIKRRKTGNYPETPKAYLDVARNYSSISLVGPPICDELIALIQHMYTEEEATIVGEIFENNRKSRTSACS